MDHLTEGRLQAFLDDELDPRERPAAAQHVLRCEACRGVLEDLKDAGAVFSDAIAVLDHPVPEAPTGTTGRGFGRGFAGRSVARAAVLVLLLAAAASAAVPGSPVHEWIVQRTGGGTGASAPVAQPERAEDAGARTGTAGVSISPQDGQLEITLTGLRDMSIRLRRTDGDAVSVTAAGADVDPRFSIEAGRVEAVGGRGGELIVDLPAAMASARLVVDGRLYAESAGGETRIHVPGRTSGDDLVWP